MTTLYRLATLTLSGYVTWAGSARADAVVDWDAIALQAAAATTTSHPSGTIFLDIAMIDIAVYDAVESINHRFRPYQVEIAGASGSTAAATAKAARDMIVVRFPDQAAVVDAAYHTYLSNHGLAENDPGVAVGEKAAAAIIALRANDGSYPSPPPPPFTGGTQPGEWRPTLPAFAPFLAEWLAFVTPFTLTSPSQFRAAPPPTLDSGKYTHAYNEVKALGELSSTSRTPEQTDLAYFWAGNYAVSWHRVLRDLATAHLQSIDDSARLFALVGLAMADAAITAWDTKRHYVFWRPITAIQEGDNDGNKYTAGDPTWQPLIDTPPYPDYTSGANNVTGAVTRILQLFFRNDEMMFSITTTNPKALQQTRTYSRFSQAADEVVVARIYEGIHFRFADVVARRQGRHVANWAFAHFLRPVSGSDDDIGGDENDDSDME